MVDLAGTWNWHNRSNDTPWEQMGVADKSGTNSLISVKFEPLSSLPNVSPPKDVPLSWSGPWFRGTPLKFLVGPDGREPSMLGLLWAHLLPELPGGQNPVLLMVRSDYSLAGTTAQTAPLVRMYYVGNFEDAANRPKGSTQSFFGHAGNNSADARVQTFRLYR